MQGYANSRTDISDSDRSTDLVPRAMRVRLKQALNASLNTDWSAKSSHVVIAMAYPV